MTEARKISLDDVRSFWDANPVAAGGIGAAPGTREFFRRFDEVREGAEFEPYEFSNRIHGYTSSRGKRILDVGCGNGYVLSRYARNGAEVSGADLSKTAVELSKQRFALENMSGTFHVIDGKTLPFPDAHFDIACSMGVLHHSPEPGPLVAEMHRVLKPGGKIIIMLYNRWSYKYQVLFRLLRLGTKTYRGRSQAEAANMNDGVDCPLARVYSKSEAKQLLAHFADHQFKVNLISWEHLLVLPSLAAFANRNLPSLHDTWLARLCGWNLYIIAKKP